ncbi:MAG TPA: AMP-binding protein [Paralcaligenes sp.]
MSPANMFSATAGFGADGSPSVPDREPIQVLDLYPPHGDTLWGLVKSRAAILGDRPFIFFNGVQLSWAAFRDKVVRVARLLRAHGVEPGDRVGIMADNSDDYVVIFFATAYVGAIFIPINPRLTVAETAYILNNAQPALVFCVPASDAILRAACQSLEPLPHIASLANSWEGLAAAGSAGDDAVNSGVDSVESAAPEDTALILYTSGTTGFPKGVMHSQRSIVMAGEYFVERLHLQPEDRLLCVLPFFHINALIYSLLGAVAAGSSLVIAPRFSASEFWTLAAESGATQVNIIATVGRILMRRPRSEFVAGHHIRKLYGAPITADIYSAFQTEFRIPVLIEGYGLTEAPGICSNPFNGPHKVGSIGIPTHHPDPGRPYAQMRVADESGRELPRGSTGELLVNSPIAMQGYYRDTAASDAAFLNGWFRTGDLVRQEEDGYYTFIERQKDIIRRRGENISGAELDRIIGQHGEVQTVAAIAVGSELGEDDILVAVIVKQGSTLTERELRKWCEQRLNSAKLPRYIAFVDSLPYTPSHRIAKFQLRRDPDLRQRAVEFPDMPVVRV